MGCGKKAQVLVISTKESIKQIRSTVMESFRGQQATYTKVIMSKIYGPGMGRCTGEMEATLKVLG